MTIFIHSARTIHLVAQSFFNIFSILETPFLTLSLMFPCQGSNFVKTSRVSNFSNISHDVMRYVTSFNYEFLQKVEGMPLIVVW